jgi:hypothetical protein
MLIVNRKGQELVRNKIALRKQRKGQELVRNKITLRKHLAKKAKEHVKI